MIENRGHPVLLLHGPIDGELPLFLVVGREPNCTGNVSDHVSFYDCRKLGTVGFWNAPFTVAARCAGLASGPQLKRWCAARNASPVVFADALPRALPHHAVAKDESRAGLLDSEITHHIENMFRHEPILRRCELVILSGIGGPAFRRSTLLLENRCLAAGLTTVHTPFMQPFNTIRIMAALNDEARARLRRIAEAYRPIR